MESSDALFKQAWAALEGPPKYTELVTFTGHGSLPSRLATLDVMAASVAASTLAFSVLRAARSGGEPEPVTVDLAHVTVASCSERFAHVVGEPPETAMFAPLSRFWRTRDGWIRLHGNYEWHRERALKVLACTEDQAGDAIGERSSEELEDALAEAGALGFVVRTPEQWRAHPHGAAVTQLPLMKHRRNGQGTTDGFKVLDLTRVIAGPIGTRTLAAWGADVLRIDSPRLPELPAQALDTLPGKRSALLDFATHEGRTTLDELLNVADVVIQGYRPGGLARFGLGTDELAEKYPRLSVVSISAWGAGPWYERRGFDSLVQCATGIASIEGEPGALPVQALDHATGYLGAAAAMLSLARGPRSTELSLAQTAQWLMRAGLRDKEDADALDSAAFMVDVGNTRVVGPPGQVGQSSPRWHATTEFGTDAPTFGSAK